VKRFYYTNKGKGTPFLSFSGLIVLDTYGLLDLLLLTGGE